MPVNASKQLSFSREFIQPGDRICVAVSGGADSVALLLALGEANRQPWEALGVVLSAVHVHHNLRGAEADGDEEFVRELCGRLQIPLQMHRVNVPEHVEATGETVEEAARNLRYACFRQLIARGDANAVTTAHTLDDQAETVMMKLLRGAWTEGLRAIHPMLPVSGGKIIRPFLGVRRKQIEAFLREAEQAWREDSSNSDTAHTRNRVRHELMPKLREFNPNLELALGNVAELARDEEARWQTELARTLPQILLPGKPVRGGGRSVGAAPGTEGERSVAIEIERLRSFDPAMRRRVVRGAAQTIGGRLTFEETARILALCGFQMHPTVTARVGAVLQLSQQLRAERSAREIRLFRNLDNKQRRTDEADNA